MSKIGNLQNARGHDTNQRLLLYCHPGDGISYRRIFRFSCCMICYIPTAASCFQHGQKTREEVKVLGVCRWWMITKSEVMRLRFSIPAPVDNGLRAVLTTCYNEPYVNSRPRPGPSRFFNELLNGDWRGCFNWRNSRKGWLAWRRERFYTIWHLNATTLWWRKTLFITNCSLFNAFCLGRKHPLSRSTVAKRVKYYIPSLAWIPNYSLSLYVPCNS